MARKFQVGDRVRVNCPTSLAGYHGRECTITGTCNLPRMTPSGLEPARSRYVVDLAPLPGRAITSYDPHELIPLYDGHEKTSWSECAWQPNSVRA
jgi:hypothetical protein